jgi:hypothetical protein
VPRVPSPRAGVTPHGGDAASVSSEDVTPPSSLLRTHSPVAAASPLLRFLASLKESSQVVTSPCCPLDLPDVISENLSLDAGSHTPAVPPRALACFFRGVIGRLPANCPLETTSCGTADFGAADISLCSGLQFCVAPQVVPTAARTTAGQPGLLRLGRTCFVASARTGYANRPDSGN